MARNRRTTILIDGANRRALFSALRRHHAADAIEQIGVWGEDVPDYHDDDDEQTELGLTTWVRSEVRQHVEGGRFEHAMVLVDRYGQLPGLVLKDPTRVTPPSQHAATVTPFRRPL